jgi:hypothetical protein
VKNPFVALMLAFASCAVASAQAKPIGELRRMFDYEQRLPLNIRKVGVEDKDGASVAASTAIRQRGRAGELRVFFDSFILLRARVGKFCNDFSFDRATLWPGRIKSRTIG